MNVPVLGPAHHRSPLTRWVTDTERVPATIVRTVDTPPADGLLFELAGARENLFFNPRDTRAGIVTCGGLSPGLNDVIRSLFFEIHHAYGVKEVLGFRWGYQGLDPERGAEPFVLTPDLADRIVVAAITSARPVRGYSKDFKQPVGKEIPCEWVQCILQAAIAADPGYEQVIIDAALQAAPMLRDCILAVTPCP